MNPIFISQLKATIPKQKRAVKNFRPNHRTISRALNVLGFLLVLKFISRSHARNIKKWSRYSQSLFVHRVINSSKHFYPIIWIKCQPKDQHLSRNLRKYYVNIKSSWIYQLLTAWRHKHTKKPPELVSLSLPFPAPYINQEKLCQISSAHIKCRIN